MLPSLQFIFKIQVLNNLRSLFVSNTDVSLTYNNLKFEELIKFIILHDLSLSLT